MSEEVIHSNSFKWYKVILNKYFVISFIFIIWMLFFDQNSYLVHKELNKELNDLRKNKSFYEKELEAETKDMHKLKNDLSEVERIGRERFLLKKEDEDVFIIEKRITQLNKNE